MDVEKPVREQLIRALGGNFLAVQEVELVHPYFSDVSLRADVVAIPLDGPLKYLPIAFEVKKPPPGDESKYTIWCLAIKQASDYVFAEIADKRLADFRGKRIVGAFDSSSAGVCPEFADRNH